MVPVLVGRDSEIAVVESLLAAIAGGGGSLLVLGDPGIGKSALVGVAAGRAAEAGMRVLACAGVPSEAPFSFAGLHPLLRPVLAEVDGLSRRQRDALLTALRCAGSGRPPAGAGGGGGESAGVELPLTAGQQGSGGALDEWIPLTRRLEQAFASRLPALPEVTFTALLAAGSNDGDNLAEALAAASRVAGAEVSVADLADAVAEGLAEVDRRSLRFRHPLVRSAASPCTRRIVISDATT